MNFNHTRYALDSLTLAAMESGDAQTAELSVVFLHGWLDNAASFQTVMNHLSALNPSLHLCAIDLPGHGLSQHKSGSNFYPFHDYIDDVYQFLAKLSPNRTLLVGHSLGALIASCYSAAFPEQISGLVQIEGLGPLAESPDNSVSRLRNGVLGRQRIRRKPLRTLQSVDEAVRRRASVNQIEKSLIAPVVERSLHQQDGRLCWRHDTHLQCDSLYRMSPEHARAIQAEVLCPQLVILGEQGFQHLRAESALNASEKTKIVTISGGHHCHLQQPSRVSDLIFGLVNKI